MCRRAPLTCLIAATVASLSSWITASAAEKPTIPAAARPVFDRAVGYLRSRTQVNGGQLSLAGLALVKAGEPIDSPVVAKALAGTLKLFTKNPDGTMTYKPHTEQEGVYEAGVDIMLLLAVHRQKYQEQVAAATQYLISRQRSDGSWTYPDETVGDTSMTQYAMLGFWSARVAGVEVPASVWSRAAQWHLRTQRADGGFSYHPGTPHGPEQGASTHNLTNAGVGSLFIARMFLYPEYIEEGEKKKPKTKKFGILEDADPNAGKPKTNEGNAVPLNALNNGIRRGLNWANTRFVLETPNVNKNYYYYTVERVASFAELDQIGGKDWYNECLGVLKQRQKKDGSWATYTSPENATSFAILFMVKATAKLIATPVGGGLLAGGRGLPENLGEANVDGGQVKKKRKMEGPLDELLTSLASQDISVLEDAQQAIVEKVQIGDPKQLLKEMDRVRKLADHPHVEVRRTAVWALGRSRSLRDAGLLIRALQDENADVVVEANNALSYLSRKLSGVGVAENPYEDLAEDASDAQKSAALKRWQKEALAGWAEWYLRVRPYEDRNDAFELQLRNAVKRK